MGNCFFFIAFASVLQMRELPANRTKTVIYHETPTHTLSLTHTHIYIYCCRRAAVTIYIVGFVHLIWWLSASSGGIFCLGREFSVVHGSSTWRSRLGAMGLTTGPTHAKLVSLTSPCCSRWPCPMNTLKANNGPLDPGMGDERFFRFTRIAWNFWIHTKRYLLDDIKLQQVNHCNET